MTHNPVRCLIRDFLVLAVIAGMSLNAWSAGNIDESNKYAWAENAGWVNFAPSHGGVSVFMAKAGYLSGYAWSESIGWIKLGVAGAGPYGNTTADDWGVNAYAGQLFGYAWSENAGWINFYPAHSRVTIDLIDGTFDGYAWSENLGWIHFQNAAPAYSVQTSGRMPQGAIFLFH